MLALPSIVLSVAVLTFVGMVLLVGTEQRNGERIVLIRFRSWVDRMLTRVAAWLRSVAHVIAITFVYVVHQLRAALAALIAPRPRRRKQRGTVSYERTESHLSQMHDHKADTALTETQKKKLRNKKLEERF